MGPEPPAVPDQLKWAASNFAVDRITAEITGELAARGIDSVLLKGPTIATWLYVAGDQPRLYGDSDLLIRKGDWQAALAAMTKLGFEDALGPLAHPRMESGEGYAWRRADGAEVDLHYTLFGVTVEPETAWSLLLGSAEAARVGGATVRVLSRPARLVHIGLHAVQHAAPHGERPMVDLERALEVASREEWEQAAEVAAALGATETFAAALAELPSGERLLGEIGIEAGPAVAPSLRLESAPLAEGFEELASAQGIRPKLDLLRREAFPNPAFMRWWHPLARRGVPGMVLAYVWRLVWLARHAVPGFRAWRRGRRAGTSARD